MRGRALGSLPDRLLAGFDRRVPVLGLEGGANFLHVRGVGAENGRRKEEREGKEEEEREDFFEGEEGRERRRGASSGGAGGACRAHPSPVPFFHSEKILSEPHYSPFVVSKRGGGAAASPCQDPPMNERSRRHRSDLHEIARRAMREKGLTPDFPKAALEQLDAITAPAPAKADGLRDLRALLWASIDNDDSRDLDQLSVAEALPNGETRVLVAIADVDALVKKGTPLDERAAQNTTSVYTAGGVFPMLPEKLSTDLTSLNQDEDRLAVVIEYRRGRRRSAARRRTSTGRSSATRRSSRTTPSTRGATAGARCPRRWRRCPASTRRSASRSRPRRSCARAATRRARSTSRRSRRARSSTARRSRTSRSTRRTSRASSSRTS